jgi:DNA-binding NarL/FixJ family response regulator
MTPIRVLLADYHELVRAGFRALLASLSDVEVVAEADDGRAALELIAEGRTVKQISKTLGISVKTVETHRAQIMERLDIHDLAGLVRYVIRAGIIASGE